MFNQMFEELLVYATGSCMIGGERLKAELWRLDGSRRQSKKQSSNVVSGFRFRNPLLRQPGSNPFNECEVRRNSCSCRADRIELPLSFDWKNGSKLSKQVERSRICRTYRSRA